MGITSTSTIYIRLLYTDTLAYMTGLIEAVVLVFAVARLTRLVCADKITEPVRTAAAVRLRAGNWLAYLLHCRWCVSVWIAFPAAAVWCSASPVPRWSGLW